MECKLVEEEEEEESMNSNDINNKKVVVTKPLSLEQDSVISDLKGSVMLKGILTLLKDVRPGSDLTKLQLPPQFNFPKSQLQVYGESVYSVRKNMLRKCNREESPIERFIAVIAWNISNLRPWIFGFGPYNPILGETHHVSHGTLNILLEEISHHPPVTALHATDETENLDILWCLHAVPKFYGTSALLQMYGKRELKLMNHGETYVMDSPKIAFKFFPKPRTDWTGNVRIRCHETGLEAELYYGGKSFLGLGTNPRAVKGKIFYSATPRPIFEINGQWDKIVTLKNLKNGEIRDIYVAKEFISGLQTPIVKNPKGVMSTESTAVWGEVSRGIMSGDWGNATRIKRHIEEHQRMILKERQARGQIWAPKHFSVSHSKEAGWDCEPISKLVPPAPIVCPVND